MLQSMFKNSIFPLLAAVVTSGFGFLFWLVTARLYDDHEVGLAATLTSTFILIATFSLVGFDTATIRFLEKERDKNKSITTGLAVVGIAACTLACVYILLAPHLSPALSTLTDSPLTATLFTLFAVFAALNMYTDAIFLAYRKTQYTLAIDTAFSALKVCLPFAFIEWGAFGIFLAGAVAQASGFLLSISALVRSFGYRPSFHIDHEFIAHTKRFSRDNYLADIIGFIPIAALPILVTNLYGPAQAAYYSIVMLIAGLLFTIPSSVMNALLAESSFDEGSTTPHLRNAGGIVALLLLPAMAILLLFGSLILTAFGGAYSAEGSSLLTMLTLACIPVAASLLYATLFRMAKDTGALLVRSVVFATGVALFFPIFSFLGLLGVGVSYLCSATLSAIACHLLFQRRAHTYEHPHFRALAERLTIPHLARSARLRFLEEVVWPLKTCLVSRMAYRRARRTRGTNITILTYPDKPHTYHILYRVFHELGWHITNDPSVPADLRMRFKDATVWYADETLAALRERHPVLNAKCENIGKSLVDDVFFRTFGYRTRIDPRTHNGTCVRKSEDNAVHDGTLVTCPCEPEPGYLYQQFIPTAPEGAPPVDMRVSVSCGEIPLVMKRYHAKDDPFNLTVAEEMLPTERLLSSEEQDRIIRMCEEMGLDYGELDVLRDVRDGRVYVVDVNNTPAGPIGPVYNDPAEFERWLSIICDSTERTFTKFGKITEATRPPLS